MILVAGGDSFIHGAELADQTNSQPSAYTFPALLAKSTGDEYICVAHPGNSNNAIARMTMTKCHQLLTTGQEFSVIVMWTFMQRFEFCFRENGWRSINSWDIGNDQFATDFFKKVGDSEYYEVYSKLKEIVFMQNYLKMHNIPYLFLEADVPMRNCINYTRTADAFTSSLYEQIDWSKWEFFSDTSQGFYQWANDNKYALGTQNHPLEAAHKHASELIKEKYNELVKKHN